MGILPLDQFMCWKLKTATLAVTFFVIGSASLAGLLEILDIAALADENFEIRGGFKSSWRAHVWEGWLACNIVTLVCHLIMIGYSIVMIFAVRVFPTYYEFNLTKGYLALLIIYVLVDLGVACYKYSWYSSNTFRLAFLVFSFLYWLIRTLLNVTGVIIIHSRISEVAYEIRYGEKKNLAGWDAGLIDPGLRSGYTTPGGGFRSGSRTPLYS